MARKKEFSPGTLHKSGEDYLEAILILSKEKGEVHAIDIAEFLGFSKPSVSVAMSVLKEAGYIETGESHLIRLTAEGTAIAGRVYERHLFFTRFLIKTGVEEKTAEKEACLMEHVVSTETFACMKNFLEPLL